MDNNWTTIILAFIGILTGTAITIKFIRNRKEITKTKQVRNIVGGDQAGRDINKH